MSATKMSQIEGKMEREKKRENDVHQMFEQCDGKEEEKKGKRREKE